MANLADVATGGDNDLIGEEINGREIPTAAEVLPEMPPILQEEAVSEIETVPEPVTEAGSPAVVGDDSSNQPASAEQLLVPVPEAAEPVQQTVKPADRPHDDRRYESRAYGRKDRPLTNEDKLRMYKKQSEERLLDIKRSREAKIGKKRK